MRSVQTRQLYRPILNSCCNSVKRTILEEQHQNEVEDEDDDVDDGMDTDKSRHSLTDEQTPSPNSDGVLPANRFAISLCLSALCQCMCLCTYYSLLPTTRCACHNDDFPT